MSKHRNSVFFVKNNISNVSTDTIDVLHSRLKNALDDSKNKDSFSVLNEKQNISDNTFNSSLTFNKGKSIVSQKEISEYYKTEIYTEINQKLLDLKKEMNNMNKQIKNIQHTNTQKETEKEEKIKESVKNENNNEDIKEIKERLDKIETLTSGFVNEMNTIKAEMIVITNKINALKNNLFSLLESNLPLLEEIDQMKKAISELQDFHEHRN